MKLLLLDIKQLRSNTNNVQATTQRCTYCQRELCSLCCNGSVENKIRDCKVFSGFALLFGGVIVCYGALIGAPLVTPTILGGFIGVGGGGSSCLALRLTEKNMISIINKID